MAPPTSRAQQGSRVGRTSRLHRARLDLAERPIKKGQGLIGSLALPNVALQQLDLLQAPANLGRFDYIIAHGLYSWVPSAVRDKLLALCGAHLAEQGVAYISYNAYPGNHLRDMARRMMHYHVAHFEGAEQQIRQGRALLKFLAEAKPEPDLYHRVVRQELERSLKYTDPGFFHDDLSATNQPVYFHEFIQHAARHQLQYLAEADIADMQEEEFPEPVRAVLRELEGSDVIAREQYLDFLKGRAFRQTLLCRREVKLDRQLKPERTFQLQVASPSRPVTSGGQVSTPVMEDFAGAKGAIIATSRPTVKAALLRLGQAWPRSVPFAELLGARASFDPEAAPLSPAEEKEEAALDSSSSIPRSEPRLPRFLFGRSTHSLAQARAALAEGFDYIGFGPLFPTPTKAGRPAIGLQEIAAMEREVGSKIPAFCIGGITPETLPQVLAAGARRVVIVSALLKADNVELATRAATAALNAALNSELGTRNAE